ncbi:MAG: hypothetical protein EP144_06730 [Alistipes sp.]|nr:hypothetical protein [Alistipes sp.]
MEPRCAGLCCTGFCRAGLCCAGLCRTGLHCAGLRGSATRNAGRLPKRSGCCATCRYVTCPYHRLFV